MAIIIRFSVNKRLAEKELMIPIKDVLPILRIL